MPLLHCGALHLVLLGALAHLAACEVRAAAQQGKAQTLPRPMQKVIKLLEDLENEVKQEGAAEAQTYDDFACFCRDATSKKSTAIVTAKANIEDLSSTIAEKIAQRKVDEQELVERQAKHESLQADVQAKRDERVKEEADYNAEAADIGKAVSSLRNAKSSLEAGKPPDTVLLSLRGAVSRSLARALEGKQKAVGSFLQARSGVDPVDPQYAYHSQGILDTLTQLLTEFTATQTEINSEWNRTKQKLDDAITSLDGQISNNTERMGDLDLSIDGLKVDVAQARKALVMEQAETTDDKAYLKDLTQRCEARAKDWDQRSQMRKDELAALDTALEILENRAKAADSEVNKRALLQKGEGSAAHWSPPSLAEHEARAERIARPLSLLQGVSVRSHDHDEAASNERRDTAVQMLVQENRRLKSPVLASILMQVTNDPFEQVKQMIQELVERLLREENSETKKEFYCREELGKAEKDRDFRFEDAKRLNFEIATLETQEDELEQEIEVLSNAIDQLNESLVEATDLRNDEHVENMDVISKAKPALEAMEEAIVVIKTFYKQAANAVALVQASPVEEDPLYKDPGFSGSYGGKQESSKGIISMLEVIKTDFARTIKKTTQSEKDAQASFVDFERVSKADISGKTTKMELDQEDLEKTRETRETKMDDLKTATNLMDAALEQLEALKATCIDFGMSYADRVEQREQEIQALCRALEILSPPGNPETCGSLPTPA